MLTLAAISAGPFGWPVRALSGPPDLPDFQSPDQRYAWRVEATRGPVRYELMETDTRRILVAVTDYFSDQENHALAASHARNVAVYWNDRSTLVALDEFNYRRAGRLYLFWIQRGKANPIRIESLIRTPRATTEARFCVWHGWRSATRISIRLAAQNRTGEVVSKTYLLDLTDPVHPKAQPE